MYLDQKAFCAKNLSIFTCCQSGFLAAVGEFLLFAEDRFARFNKQKLDYKCGVMRESLYIYRLPVYTALASIMDFI